MSNGRIRDIVCYTIIKSEWKQVKENLMENHTDIIISEKILFNKILII